VKNKGERSIAGKSQRGQLDTTPRAKASFQKEGDSPVASTHHGAVCSVASKGAG